MSQGLGSNFDRAQRAYDNRMPDEETNSQIERQIDREIEHEIQLQETNARRLLVLQDMQQSNRQSAERH